MIKPQEKIFANLIAQRRCDLPLKPLTRLVNLAAVAVRMGQSKSLHVGQIVTPLPLGTAAHVAPNTAVRHCIITRPACPPRRNVGAIPNQSVPELPLGSRHVHRGASLPSR